MGYSHLRRALAGASFAFVFPAIAGGQALIRGVLYDDATGAPLRGTVMLVDPVTDAAVVLAAADSQGTFNLRARLGTYRLAAIHPGYTSVLSAEIRLGDGERLTIRIPIAQDGDPQHQIGVLEHVRPGAGQQKTGDETQGMVSRRDARRAAGFGSFYDRERLVKSGFQTLGQFLQTVPGVRVGDPSSANSMRMSRSSAVSALGLRGPTGAACRVGWFMDGHRIDLPGQSDPLTDGLGSTQLETIESVEVFRGISELPAEFASPDLRCGAIAIWTRRG